MAETYATFGNYLLLKERSRDGLGTLRRAGEMERGGFKRIVWLRCFDQEDLDRSVLEAELPLVSQLAQTLKATNVVRNQVAQSEGGVPFLAWDYVPAQPLAQLLERVAHEQFPVAIDNSLLIAEKLAAALAAGSAVELRGEPLVHGFLVPHLVLVGNDGEALVAGFGLVRGLLANLDRVAVHDMAAPYLAPEVLSTGSASRRADVYSLGAILYQLLCGEPLPADPDQRAAKIESPQLALDEGPVPEDIAAILRRALAPRPEDRYTSASEFKRDLERLLYGGAYSPTTFNLALFMDRLYRTEIEEEDRELQRERSIDTVPFYKPPKAATGEVAMPTEGRASSKVGIWAMAGALVVLLAVIAYLVFGRAPAPPPIDEQAQQKMLGELVQSEIAKQLAEREAALRGELEAEKQRSDELRGQIEQLQSSTRRGTQRLSAAEQQQLEQAQRDLAAGEEEQRQREQELEKVRRQRAEAEAAAVVPPTPIAASPTQAPTRAPVAQATAAPQEAEAVETPVRQAQVIEPTPATAQPPAPRAGGATREGDFVDFSQVDVPPQELVSERPVLPRAALMARAGRGVVILSALVNEKGTVDSVEVLRGFPASRLGIDEACVEAVKRYRFRPATKDGVKVKTKTTVTIQIDLSQGR